MERREFQFEMYTNGAKQTLRARLVVIYPTKTTQFSLDK